jgi:hypothetical protein
MAAIVIRGTARATWVTGLSGLLATACAMVARAADFAAAAVLICAAGAAVLVLAVQLLSFPAPIAGMGITVMAVTLLHGLRRHLRARRVSLARRR